MGGFCVKQEKEQSSVNPDDERQESDKNDLSKAPMSPQAVNKKEIPNSDSSLYDKSNSIEPKYYSVRGNYDEGLDKRVRVNFSSDIIINEKISNESNLNLSNSLNAKKSQLNYEEFEKYKEENQNLKADLEALSKKCSASYEKYDKIIEDNELYIKNIQTLSNQLKNYKEQLENKTKQKSMLITHQSQIISIKSSLQYEKLEKGKNEFESQLFVLKSSLEKKSIEYDEVSKKLTDSEAELIKQTEGTKKISKKLEKVLKNKEKTDQEFKLLQDKLFVIENDFKKEIDEKTQLSKISIEYEKKLKNAVEENTILLTAIKSLEVVYIQEKNKELLEKNNESDSKSQHIKSLMDNNVKFAQNIKTMNVDIIQEQLENLKQENEKLAKELIMSKELNRKYEKQIDEVTSEVLKDSEIIALTQNNKIANQNLAELQEKYNELAKINANTKYAENFEYYKNVIRELQNTINYSGYY